MQPFIALVTAYHCCVHIVRLLAHAVERIFILLILLLALALNLARAGMRRLGYLNAALLLGLQQMVTL